MRSNLQKKYWWAVVIIYMSGIFYFSHQPANVSNELSTGITRMIIETIQELTHQDLYSMETINYLLRKSTHFVAYFGLALILWLALDRSKKRYLYAWGFATLYAVTDEFHQLFVDGRGGQAKDVAIDSLGAATAMLLLYSTNKLVRKFKSPDRMKH